MYYWQHHNLRRAIDRRKDLDLLGPTLTADSITFPLHRGICKVCICLTFKVFAHRNSAKWVFFFAILRMGNSAWSDIWCLQIAPYLFIAGIWDLRKKDCMGPSRTKTYYKRRNMADLCELSMLARTMSVVAWALSRFTVGIMSFTMMVISTYLSNQRYRSARIVKELKETKRRKILRNIGNIFYSTK